MIVVHFSMGFYDFHPKDYLVFIPKITWFWGSKSKVFDEFHMGILCCFFLWFYMGFIFGFRKWVLNGFLLTSAAS